MPTNVKCPNCSHVFDIEDVLSAEVELKYQKDYQEKLNQSIQLVEADKKRLEEEKKTFEEKKKKENELFCKNSLKKN